MDDAVPSLSSTGVGSRFVSQSDIDSAKERRDEQWKAAYARLGQVPPPQPTEDVYDGRSLAEKLAANRAAKQEEWEEKTKLANQFRALEEDEVLFLDSLRDDQYRKELKRKQEDAEELKGFKQAIAAKNSLPEKPPALSISSSSSTPSVTAKTKSPTIATAKKVSGVKAGLKGVIVKKKKPSNPALRTPDDSSSSKNASSTASRNAEDAEGPSKRRRVSSPTALS